MNNHHIGSIADYDPIKKQLYGNAKYSNSSESPSCNLGVCIFPSWPYTHFYFVKY